MQSQDAEIQVRYVQNLTILDVDPDRPPFFDSWEDADQFASGLQQTETVSRWLMGLAAKQLPKEDTTHNFESWCHSSGYSPGRVAVWRRMAEVYDLKNEVQRFPRLTHKHFEVLLGRMSKAKEKGDHALYESLMDTLADAQDNSLSCNEMIAKILDSEGKRKEIQELPLKIQGQLEFFRIDLGNGEPDCPLCLIIIPKSEIEAQDWVRLADERGLTSEVVRLTCERVDTE